MSPKTPWETDRILAQTGWVLFDRDPTLLQWLQHALPAARKTLHDPAQRHWWRYDHTWFVGVNALNNNIFGAVASGPPLAGLAWDYIVSQSAFCNLPLDKAQVSVCFPGYPGRSDKETAASHLYRLRRDAAHIDGLLRQGPDRRRHLGQYHAYILGIPMVDFPAQASPFVVWEGSHRLVQQFFRQWLTDREPATWKELDLTEAYHALRRDIFRRCPRKPIHAVPGQCYLVHRMTLHGMAPWQSASKASSDGRMICYFRPEFQDPHSWLNGP